MIGTRQTYAAAMAMMLCAPAAAQDAPGPGDAALKQDIRCLVVYLQMMNSTDRPVRNAGIGGTFYWFGRVDGRAPGLDIEKRLMDETAAITPDEFKTETKRCVTEMVARGKSMMETGQHMQEKASPPSPQPQPGEPKPAQP